MIRALSLLVALVASPALAQDPPADDIDLAGRTEGEAPAVVYKERTEYDFEDDIVEGGTLNPDMEYTDGRVKDRHRSLIRIRTHFLPALLASAEDL